MGNISAFIIKSSNLEIIKFTANFSLVTNIIFGCFLFCIIIIFGYYIYKSYKIDEKYSETENIKLGENKGFIRKKIDN